MARALAWHARGHEFDSRILHKKGNLLGCLFLWRIKRGEGVTSEALLIKGGFGRIVRVSPSGCASIPEFDSRILHKKQATISVAFFVANGVTYPPNPLSVKGAFRFAQGWAMKEHYQMTCHLTKSPFLKGGFRRNVKIISRGCGFGRIVNLTPRGAQASPSSTHKKQALPAFCGKRNPLYSDASRPRRLC